MQSTHWVSEIYTTGTHKYIYRDTKNKLVKNKRFSYDIEVVGYVDSKEACYLNHMMIIMKQYTKVQKMADNDLDKW